MSHMILQNMVMAGVVYFMQSMCVKLVMHYHIDGEGAAEERLEGDDLENWLNMVEAPMELAAFIRSDYVAPAEQLSTS